MSFVNTRRISCEKDFDSFKVSISSTGLTNLVHIGLTYKRGKNELDLDSLYGVNILDLQTTSPKDVAEVAVKYNLEKISEQLVTRERALNSRKTYTKLKQTTANLIDYYLDRHEGVLQIQI